MMDFDPLNWQKKMIAEWEKQMDSMLREAMRQPAILKSLMENLEGTLDFQAMVRDSLKPVLRGLKIPDEGEIIRLQKLAQNLESRILDLEEKLQAVELKTTSGTAQSPAKPKTPPTPKSSPTPRKRGGSKSR